MSKQMVLWAPAVCVTAHLIEEFLWPGGFADWFRAYRPERALSVTNGYLIRINALFVAMAFLPPIFGATQQGLTFWLIVASIAATNGLFHIYATIRMRRYSPGLVTGTLVYIPLLALGYTQFIASGRVHPVNAVQALLIGPAYLLFSAWNHRRRARARA